MKGFGRLTTALVPAQSDHEGAPHGLRSFDPSPLSGCLSTSRLATIFPVGGATVRIESCHLSGRSFALVCRRYGSWCMWWWAEAFRSLDEFEEVWSGVWVR